MENQNTAFINETSALSPDMQNDTLKSLHIENVESAFILICTDGVSSGIIEGSEQSFFEEIAASENIFNMGNEFDKLFIKMSEFNSDDKTIGLLRYE
jgi:DNA polymerase III delta prime subunit